MKKFSFTRRLMMLIRISSIIIFIMTLYSIFNLHIANENIKSLYNDRVIPLKQLKSISDLYAINIVDCSHKTRNGNISWQQGFRTIDSASKDIIVNWEAYKKTYLTVDEKKLIGQAEILITEANKVGLQIRNIIKKGKTPEHEALLVSVITKQLYQKIDPLTAKINELTVIQLNEADRLKKASDYIYDKTILLAILAAITEIFILFLTRYKKSMEFIINEQTYELESANEELKSYNEELQTLNEALSDYKFNLENMVEEKTQELKVSENKFKQISLNLPISIGCADEDGNILFTNPCMVETFGYSEAELSHINKWFELVYPDNGYRDWAVKKWFQDIEEYKSGKTSSTPKREYLITCKNGSVKTVEISFAVQDKINYVIFIDVTEKKNALDQLSKSEEKFAKLFVSSPDAILLTEMANGKIVEVNESFLRFSGFGREDTIGKETIELNMFSPEERQRFIGLLKENGSIRDVEFILSDIQGKLNLVLASAEVIQIGNKPHIITTLRDITERKDAEMALEESEKKFKNIFNSTLDTISLVDFETGKYLDVNNAFKVMSGKTYEELIGKSREDLSFWYNEDERKEYLRQLNENGRVQNLEMQWNASGTIYDCILSTEIIEINSKKVLLTTSKNVSDLKALTNVIIENEEKYRSLFENSGDAIFLNKGDKFIDCNKKATEIFGCTREDIVGKGPSDFSPEFQPDGRLSSQLVYQHVQNALKGENRFFEWVHCKKDGTTFFAEVTLTKFEVQKEIYFLGIVRDISQRKQIEQELEEYRENLERRVNERTEEIVVLNEELSSTNEALTAINADLQMQKEKLEDTLNILQKTQAHLIQSEKMAALGVMVAGVAHEINNPVNFISSSLSTLKQHIEIIVGLLNDYRSLNDAEQFEKLRATERHQRIDAYISTLQKITNIIEEGTKRTSQIVRNLYTYSRPTETDALIDMNDLADLNLDFLNNQLKDNISVEKDYGKIPVVLCNSGEMNQVLLNILSNAIQAIEGEGKIRIATGRAKDEVYVSITDNGKGIPDNIKDKIFDPFFTTKEVGKGTGLGLYLSYDIIKKHNGRITVASEQNKGTTFVIYLPVPH